MGNLRSSSRYAIYFAPSESSALHASCSQWLGRDTITGDSLVPALPASIDPVWWRTATESPRRYGFHATLKPPFRMNSSASLDQLKTSLTEFASAQRSFLLPRLVLGRLGRFLALILTETSPELHALAANCVRTFDEFRVAPGDEELAQRMHPSLSQEEQKNLRDWGYPYVLETWKFHMTLTGSLPPQPLDLFRHHLQVRLGALCEHRLVCDSVCLFEESSPNTDLRLIERFSFAL